MANETGNNIEYEKKIAATDRQAAKLRIEYQNQDANRVQLQDEVNLPVSDQINRNMSNFHLK